jgi:hypothetical protein
VVDCRQDLPPDRPARCAASGAAAVTADNDAIRTTLQTLNTAGRKRCAPCGERDRPACDRLHADLRQLVGISAAEGQARLAARKAAGEASKGSRQVAMVDSDGDAAVAKLEHDLPTGTGSTTLLS